MRAAVPILIASLLVPSLAGCREKTQADAVRQTYDNKAAAIDAQASQQPTPTARKIYKAHADAIREEGADRAKGLEGRAPSPGQGGGATAGGSNTAAGDRPQ